MFVVEVLNYEAKEYDNIVSRFITHLRIAPNKAIKMLDNLPRVVTKPIPFDKAKVIQSQFDDVGVEAQLKAYRGKVKSNDYTATLTPESKNIVQSHLDESPQELSTSSTEQVATDSLVDDGLSIDLGQAEEITLTTEEAETPTLTEETANGFETDNKLEEEALETTLEDESFEEVDIASDLQRKHRYSVRGTFLRIAIFPALLVALGLWLVLFSTVRFTLNAQLLSVAQQQAIFITNHLEDKLDKSNSLDSDLNLTTLQNNIQLARQTLNGSNISFTVVSDNKGQILSSWFDQPENFTAINQEISHSIGEIAKFMVKSQGVEHSLRHPLNKGLDILAHPIVLQGQVSGAVFLGLNKSSFTPQLQHIFFSMLFITLLVFVLAFLIANFLGRNLVYDITNLSKIADKLSHGDLDIVAKAKSDTELMSLAKALERIRDGFKLSLQRRRFRN